MRRLMLAFTCILFMIHAECQNKYQTETFNPKVDSIAEALVALAMNHPTIHSSENFALQFKYIYMRSKTAWLNTVVFQANANEFTIKNLTASDPNKYNTLYPRYNVGLTVPLGIFVNNPKQTKSDYYKYKSTSDQIEAEKRNMREQVLDAYHSYVMNKQLLSLSQQLVHDWELIYLSNEDKFKKGEITLDVFYGTTRIYNDQLNRQITLTTTLQNDESKLENLIGMNINDALVMIKNRSGH
jgi:outer membrane protein TolC